MKKIYWIIQCCILLTACNTLYQPTMVQSPMLQQKGDADVSASAGLSGSGLYNLQGAFSPKEGVGLMLNGMYHPRTASGPGWKESLKVFSTEGGAGIYRKLGRNGQGLVQLYGGGGWGMSNTTRTDSSAIRPTINSNYATFFLQPGIGVVGENSGFMLDVRAKFVSMYKVKGVLYDSFDWWNTDYKLAADTSWSFGHIEPTITGYVGDENVRATFQIGFNLPVINPDGYFNAHTAGLTGISLFKFGVGLSIRIHSKSTGAKGDEE